MESPGMTGLEHAIDDDANTDEGEQEQSAKQGRNGFVKGGPSPNPAGRRGKGPIANQDSMRVRAQKYAPTALKSLIEVARYSKDARAKAGAAQVILAYAVGKPMSALEARAVAAAHSGPDPLLALHTLIQRLQPLVAKYPELRVEISAVLASMESAPDMSAATTTAPLPAPRFDQDDESDDE